MILWQSPRLKRCVKGRVTLECIAAAAALLYSGILTPACICAIARGMSDVNWMSYAKETAGRNVTEAMGREH